MTNWATRGFHRWNSKFGWHFFISVLKKRDHPLAFPNGFFWFVANSSSYDSDDGEEGHDVGDNENDNDGDDDNDNGDDDNLPSRSFQQWQWPTLSSHDPL